MSLLFRSSLAYSWVAGSPTSVPCLCLVLGCWRRNLGVSNAQCFPTNLLKSFRMRHHFWDRGVAWDVCWKTCSTPKDCLFLSWTPLSCDPHEGLTGPVLYCLQAKTHKRADSCGSVFVAGPMPPLCRPWPSMPRAAVLPLKINSL